MTGSAPRWPRLSLRSSGTAASTIEAAYARPNLEALVTAAFTVLPVSRQAFGAAADMAGLVEPRLRSGDALHIAVAAEHGSGLTTRDAAQARAAEALGVPSRLVAARASCWPPRA